jgi:hypothetical protein
MLECKRCENHAMSSALQVKSRHMPPATPKYVPPYLFVSLSLTLQASQTTHMPSPLTPKPTLVHMHLSKHHHLTKKVR